MRHSAATPPHLLRGRRLLVVEDDHLQARDLEERPLAAGTEVMGPVPSVTGALDLLGASDPGRSDELDAAFLDAAVLDINLDDDLVYPLADRLPAQGVPVLFATGTNQKTLPERSRKAPHHEKTTAADHVAQAVATMLERTSALGVRPSRTDCESIGRTK